MKTFTAGAALLLATATLTSACATHNTDANNDAAATNEVVGDDTLNVGAADDNLSAANTLGNAPDADVNASATPASGL